MKWLRTYAHRAVGLIFPSLSISRPASARDRLAASAAGPAAALALALFAAGCAPAPVVKTGDPSLPEIDVLQLKENSDEALKLAQETKLEVQTLQAKMKELEGRLSVLGDELAGLPLAKLEELTQQVALVSEQLRSLEDRMTRVPSPPPAQAKKEMSIFQPTGIDSAKPGTQDLPPAAPPAKTPPPADASGKGAPPGAASKTAPAGAAAKTAPRKPNASDAEAALYKRAFDLYYGRDYAQAIQKFEELLQKYPSGTYADNCRYWIGECHFALGNFAKAATAFRKVFAFPESEKADDAQLKLGYCYLRTGERKRAAEEFKKVVSLYPDSEYTERAKEELAKLE